MVCVTWRVIAGNDECRRVEDTRNWSSRRQTSEHVADICIYYVFIALIDISALLDALFCHWC